MSRNLQFRKTVKSVAILQRYLPEKMFIFKVQLDKKDVGFWQQNPWLTKCLIKVDIC